MAGTHGRVWAADDPRSPRRAAEQLRAERAAERMRPVDQIEAMFPVDGPHSSQRTRDAGNALTALVRYLNYATAGPAGTPYPGDVYDVIGSVKAAAYLLDQTLQQAARRMTDLAARPGAYERAAGAAGGRWPVLGDPVATAAEVCALLTQTRDGLAAAAEALNSAHVYAGRIYPPPHEDDGD